MLSSEINRFSILNLSIYRRLELLIFFGQILAFIGFIIYCKVVIWLKTKLNSKAWLDKMDDPFIVILTRNLNDFYHIENFFMTIWVLYATVLLVDYLKP